MTNVESNITLSVCAKIRSGQTFKESLTHNHEGDLCVILPKNLTEDGLTTDLISINSNIVPSLNTHILKKGEVLIANKGSRFNTFLYDNGPGKAIATTAFYVISPGAQLIPEYLSWYLNQPLVKEYLNFHASGSIIPAITKSVLLGLSIPLIPLKEQQHIIEFIAASKVELNLMRDLLSKKEQFINSYIWEQINKSAS